MASFTYRYGENLPTNEGKIKLAKFCHGKIMQKYEAGSNGAIGQYVAPSSNEPMICIRYRGILYWAAVDNLSPNKLDVYKLNIAEVLEQGLCAEEEEAEQLLDVANHVAKKGKKYEIFLELMFNEMTEEQRKKCTEQNIEFQTYVKNHTCTGCNAFTKDLSKCIHRDCTGCCSNCLKTKCFANKEIVVGTDQDGTEITFTQMIPICRGCKQEQKLECPICQRDKTPTELCQFGCSHVVCWKCFAMSAVHGQQLRKCPLCRENIEIK